MKLSVIIPAYNEEESFPKFYPSLLKVIIDTVGKSYEIVMVNDGSSDGTLKLLQDIANQNKKLRVVNFSRNFGKEIAVTAGISYAQGEAIIIIDADGQHPPELIPKFVKLWEDGYQVVIGVRESNQKEGLTKRYGSKLFYKLLNVTSDTTLIAGATDFRLIDRAVQAEFIQFSEHYRITRGLIDWMGFRRATIPFHANKRIAGQASYRVSKLIRLALNSFVSLSVAPLYIFGYVGAFITFGAFMVGLFVIIEQLILGDPLGLRVTGTAMLSILTLFLVGILLISQGLISVYLSHVHAQTQNRPLFIVDKQNSIRLT
ncbi:MAG TPA: glycosyltransferase family 2 protein [Candidatus Saccharimonadales bacterium]|jgi:dolichol-phosphate mannosyltransferase|nr:glycosyltransferase family 2 protein [Candidatus Saccharimonadales bacterium]